MQDLNIKQNSLDTKGRFLTVIFSINENKQSIQQQKCLNFEDIKLFPQEPFQESSFNINKNSVILRNISSTTPIEMVRLYCEYLIVNDNVENDIDELKLSTIIPDSFYVRFKFQSKSIERTV
jgi:hypothetical protein